MGSSRELEASILVGCTRPSTFDGGANGKSTRICPFLYGPGLFQLTDKASICARIGEWWIFTRLLGQTDEARLNMEGASSASTNSGGCRKETSSAAMCKF